MLANNLLSPLKLRAAAIVILCLASIAVYAQQEPELAPSGCLGFSAAGGYTFAHTDFRHTTSEPSPLGGIGMHHFSLRFLEISLDFQMGMFKGGSSQFIETRSTGFKNNYWASCLSFRFFPGALVEDADNDKVVKALSAVYVGTGLGYLKSNTESNPIPYPEYGAMVTYKGSDFFVPIELGLNVPMVKLKKNLFLLNLNLRTSLCLSDEVDGYVPTVEANKFNDAFSTLTAGVIYKFGL